MASQEARPFSVRLGLREYEISEEEFMHPGALVDSLLDDEICETGGFIARLSTWKPDDGAKNVRAVKSFIQGDAAFDTFHPEWLQRTMLEYRSIFNIRPIHSQSVEAENDEKCTQKQGAFKRLQFRMRKLVQDCSFSPDVSGDMVQVLGDDSVLDCTDMVLDQLTGEKNDILYLMNMKMSPPLDTCAGLSMSQMVTGLERLSNRPLLGINQPTVYIGTEYSTFPCHREDMSFCAMNRHIAGAPKIWFCVPPRYYAAFTWMIRNFPIPAQEKASVCQLLHKDLWLDPRRVLSCGIPVYAIVQRPGDIVVLLPNTIHWGFNTNINLNEAINFVCKAWVLPGMLSHQRCQCKKEWSCTFEIREVLSSLGADPEDIRDWSNGMTVDILKKLKVKQPYLYPHLKDMHDELISPSLLTGSNKVAPAVGKGIAALPQCTRCNFCPMRDRSDAFDRIFAHAMRCHGPEQAEAIIVEVRLKFPKKKIYKAPEMQCDICGKTIRGSQSNLIDHQNRSKCKKSKEHLDSSSTSAGPSKRRKVSKK